VGYLAGPAGSAGRLMVIGGGILGLLVLVLIIVVLVKVL
jgi:hypothetical protein